MKIEMQVVDTFLAFCTYRAFSPRNQDCFACTKNINKLKDCGMGGKEFYLMLTWQCSVQPIHCENKIRKIAELCTGPPYWCSTLVHQYGGQNYLREERETLLPKSSVALRNAFVIIFSTILLGYQAKMVRIGIIVALSDTHFVYSQGTVLICQGNTFRCG